MLLLLVPRDTREAPAGRNYHNVSGTPLHFTTTMEKRGAVGPVFSKKYRGRGLLKQIALAVVAIGTLLLAEKLFWDPSKNEALPRYDQPAYDDNDFDWGSVSHFSAASSWKLIKNTQIHPHPDLRWTKCYKLSIDQSDALDNLIRLVNDMSECCDELEEPTSFREIKKSAKRLKKANMTDISAGQVSRFLLGFLNDAKIFCVVEVAFEWCYGRCY